MKIKSLLEIKIPRTINKEIINQRNEFIPEIKLKEPTLETFALDQMSLSKHMQGIKQQLKKEFMEVQVMKKHKKSNDKLSKFQDKTNKKKELDDLLGFQERKTKMKFSQITQKPKMYQNKRKMSLTSEVKSPKTSEILAQVRFKPLFSPKTVRGNNKDLVASAMFKQSFAESPPFLKNKIDKPKSNFDKIKKERTKSYNSIVKNLENRQKTFARFGFKTNEKEECEYLKPILGIFWGREPKGSMMVVDLWAKKNMRKYLDSCKLNKDKLFLSKIASIREKKSDFLKDSRRLIGKPLELKEDARKFKESLKAQQTKIFNYFKNLITADSKMYETNGIMRKMNPNSITQILKTPSSEGTKNLLKDVFVNAFPGIYLKNKVPDVCYSNTEETKAITEERSLYSTVNPFFKGKKERFYIIIFLIH